MTTEAHEEELRFNRGSRPERGRTFWRCVHDGSRLLAAFATDGETDSIHQIVDFDTEEQMRAGIASLGLSDPLEVYQPTTKRRLK